MSKTSKHMEHRRNTRKPVAIKISYETMDQFFIDYASNISMGGVFIRARKPLPVGTILKVKFSIPNLDQTIKTTGTVVHIVRRKGGTYGMGLHFEDLDMDNKKLIDDLISSESEK